MSDQQADAVDPADRPMEVMSSFLFWPCTPEETEEVPVEVAEWIRSSVRQAAVELWGPKVGEAE